jgi:lysophospholipase
VFPGATEYIELYGETVADLLERGHAVGVIDWRGQGLSARPLADPRRRHIDDFNTYLEDFREIANSAFTRLPKPWILLCQSMGGAIGALVLAEHIADFAGAILLSPMLSVNTSPWPLPAARAIALASCSLGLSKRYVPGGSAVSTFAMAFDNNVLTHDATRFARLRAYPTAEPALDLGSPTIGWLQAAFRAMDALALPDTARKITCPVLLVAAGEDQVVLNGAIQRFSTILPRAQLVSIREARHDILLETELVRRSFWREYDAFVAGLPVSS